MGSAVAVPPIATEVETAKARANWIAPSNAEPMPAPFSVSDIAMDIAFADSSPTQPIDIHSGMANTRSELVCDSSANTKVAATNSGKTAVRICSGL